MKITIVGAGIGGLTAALALHRAGHQVSIMEGATSDGHLGKTYNLNGPDVLSGPGIAQIWSGLPGREIRYTGEDMDAFELQMRPSWSAFDIRMMFQGYLERGFVAGSGDIEILTKLLGHKPRSYADFAQETAQSWQSALRDAA